MIDFFGKKALTKQLAALQDSVKSLQSSRIIDALSYVNTVIYPTWGVWEEIMKYTTVDDLYSIISKRANNAATIPYYGYKVKNENALKQYFKTNYQQIQHKHWAIKAMEDLPEEDALQRFLDDPFFGHGRYQGWKASYTYFDTAGECFWYKMDRIGYGVNKGIGKLVLIPPQDMTVLLSTEFPQYVVGYRLTFRGQIFDFDPEEIVHIKNFNPTWYNGNEWRGLSPIKVLCQRLTRNHENMNNSVAQMRNGGVKNIVYDKTPQGVAVQDEVSVSGTRKDKFGRFLRNSENTGAPFFADGDMGVLQLQSSLVDLDSVAIAEVDFAKFCNAYSMPTVLFNNHDASTESNVELQMRMMWTQAILPLVTIFKDAMIKDILPDFGGVKRYIEVDLSNVTELQKDLKWQAEALSMMWWVTPNEKREIQKFDKDADPNMDKFIIDSGKSFLDDIGLPDAPPLDPPTVL